MGTASGSIASEALFWPVGTTLFLYNNRNGILTHKLELGLGAGTGVKKRLPVKEQPEEFKYFFINQSLSSQLGYDLYHKLQEGQKDI